MSSHVQVLDTPTPQAYPCTIAGCDRSSARVYVAEWMNGGRPGIGFYGYCRTHANRGRRIEPLRQPMLGCRIHHECGCKPQVQS